MKIRLSYLLTFCLIFNFTYRTFSQSNKDSLIVYHCPENKFVTPRLTLSDIIFEERYSGKQIKKGFDDKIINLIASKDTLQIVTLNYLEPRFAIFYNFNNKSGIIQFDEFGRLSFEKNSQVVYNYPDIIKLVESFIPDLKKNRKRQNK